MEEVTAAASLVELATLIGLIIGGVGGVVVAVVWAVGKYSQTRAEIAEKTIDLLKEEVDAIRRRLDHAIETIDRKDQKIEELAAKNAELQNADQLIEKSREEVSRLTSIIEAVRQVAVSPVSDEQARQINSTADAANGESISEATKRRRVVEEDIRRTVREERRPDDVG